MLLYPIVKMSVLAKLQGWERRFKSLDVYRDVPKDLTEQTVTGATGTNTPILVLNCSF